MPDNEDTSSSGDMAASRQEIYHGLLSDIGRYNFVSARTTDVSDRPSRREDVSAREAGMVDVGDEHALRTIVDWAAAGEEVVVLAHHVWGVGQAAGAPRGTPAYDYVKDRHVQWHPDEEVWTVRESERRAINDDQGHARA